MGIGIGKCVGVWGEEETCGKRYERCRKVCWGVGEVRKDVRKGEGSEVGEEMWGSVLGPHTLTHFPTHPNPMHFTTPLPTLHHSPHIFPYSSPHPNTLPYTSPHTSSHSSPHLSQHPNTLPHSPHALFHTSPHIFPHSLDYMAKLPCDKKLPVTKKLQITSYHAHK